MTEVAMARKPEPESVTQARELLNWAIAGIGAELPLNPDPICGKWILGGNPAARSKTLAFSPDGASKTVLWDCTSGSFYWHYRQDEAVLFLSGDACLVEGNGNERRFAAGDFAFFSAGTVAKWRVDSYVRKIAFLHEPTWRFAGPVLTLWNRVMRGLGFSRKSGWSSVSLRG